MTDLSAIFAQFDSLRLINLRSRPDRRKRALRGLRATGIDTVGARFSIHEAIKPQEAAGFPSPGARGCFTSHREVLREALQAGRESVMVFEDDIVFNAASPAQVAAIATQLRDEDWSIVYFGYLKPAPAAAPAGIHRTAETTLGGHCYGIRGSMIAAMVEFMDACERRPPGHPDGGPMYRDGAFNHYRVLHPDTAVHLCAPVLARQGASRTDLHALRFPDRVPGLRWVVEGLRRLKD